MAHSKSPRNDLTAEFVRSILDYDPETGVLTWRLRTDVDHEWNTSWAGKPAGRVDHWGYRVLSINFLEYKAHRIAWLHVTGAWPKDFLDHVNGARADNRLCNLREASQSQNMANRSVTKRSSSGVKGVQWDAKNKKWRASIAVNRKAFNLGRYKDLEDAKAAYAKAVVRFHGDFARAE